MSSEDQRAYNTLGVTLSEAEVLLDRYKRLMASSLPFVCLAPAVTAQELWSKKPLLLHAIATVACFHDLPKQQSMVKGFMRDVTERILMNNEKHVGIVQGLLVFVAWYHPHIFWGQQVTNLLHLAIAMTIDLGIDRAPGQCQTDFKAATTKAWHGPGMISRVMTMEEYRATAGVYYLTSMLASSFKKIDAMPYTKFMDESLQVLEETREYDSDLLLVQLVRLQHLAEDTHTAETPNAPMQMYVKAFEADLAQLRKSDPSLDDRNILLRLQYLTVEILVWELSLNELQESTTKPLRSHIDDLYRCIDAIKRFADVYFSIPANDYLILPFSVFGQFAHAFIILTKIASLEIEGWDIKTLHLSLDFAQVIEQAAVLFDASCKSAPDGQQVNNDCFGKWAHRIRWMKQVYEAKFSPSNNTLAIAAPNMQSTDHRQLYKDVTREDTTGQHDPQSQPTPQQPTPPDDVLSADFFNYLDNDFWNSFPPEYDLGFPDMSQNAVSPGYGAVGG
ncbi:hypothetical protein LTR86_000334 [Recurvomyces mirabilis]|nr:hypothetical protein LTR86_000334 [Recurvomyces mirabilis]